MSILFPFFITVAMLVGEHGTIVKDRFGPFDTKEEAEIVAEFLRYQAGMETGEIARHWRWSSASKLTPEGEVEFRRWFDALEKHPMGWGVIPKQVPQ